MIGFQAFYCYVAARNPKNSLKISKKHLTNGKECVKIGKPHAEWAFLSLSQR